MDLNEYDKLRKKINVKDFEGNNKTLDKWLYGFSFVGNIGSIFFSYFLLYPALLKAITINLVTGFLGTAIAFIFSITFLGIFEIIKRYLFRNFSSDYIANNKKINTLISGWLMVSIAIVSLSFYLSLVGSKNLATTSNIQNTVAVTTINTESNNLVITYENKKKPYEIDNQTLRDINNNLRQTYNNTPISYISARRDYQASIDKNVKAIEINDIKIGVINKELEQKIEELKSGLNTTLAGNATEDTKNIILFIIIAIFAEVIIIAGVYYHEWFEHKLHQINQQKFEKIYLKKDRYRALLAYVYNNGKANVGDKVISGLELKEIVSQNTAILNTNKLVTEFLSDMDKLNIFVTNGKRRFIGKTYQESLNIIEHYDDVVRVIENMK